MMLKTYLSASRLNLLNNTLSNSSGLNELQQWLSYRHNNNDNKLIIIMNNRLWQLTKSLI